MAIPDSLTSTTRDGETITLNHTQLTRAESIISTANTVGGLGTKGATIALMTSLVESTLRILSNVSAYPESAGYPNDGDGGDHDSLGLFQQRPTAGWGTVEELMDPIYSARAFYGGPTGPNYPSPAGVLDIFGWETMDNGEVCQAVQVSAFPDRYQNYEPVAIDIINAIGGTTPGGGNIVKIREMGNQLMVIYDNGSKALAYPTTGGLWYVKNSGGPGPGTGKFSWPFDLSTVSSEYGPRVGPIGSFHEGIDFSGGAAVSGAKEYAAEAGIVEDVNINSNYGYSVQLNHGVDSATGYGLHTIYAHMSQQPEVTIGQTVTKGQLLGYLGDSGDAQGAHLHFETHTCPNNGAIMHNTSDTNTGLDIRTAINPRDFMTTYGDGQVFPQ
jgi:murein DD-endopeptidase MepM/ murein hydrolase activator NlpD